MTGTRKKKIMIIPCIVNNLLYRSASTMSASGVSNSSRISVAAAPPRTNIKVTVMIYSTAMRLWSVVSSHERTPKLTFR